MNKVIYMRKSASFIQIYGTIVHTHIHKHKFTKIIEVLCMNLLYICIRLSGGFFYRFAQVRANW